MAAKFSTALFALLLVSCEGPSSVSEIQPLIDRQHVPDILTESRVIEQPPSLAGNRFLKGWIPWKHGDTRVLVPSRGGAELQVVNISGTPRSLVLDTRLLGRPGDFSVAVEIAGQVMPEVPLGVAVKVPLPANLPQGRVPVRLKFPQAPDPVVVTAELTKALPPGEVEIDADNQSIVQSPYSIVDFARPNQSGAQLVGRFEPPEGPGLDQRFSIVLERDSGASEVLFEWPSSWLDRWRGARSFSLPLPDEAGFIRIRLRAEGSGPAAMWRDLGITQPRDRPHGEADSSGTANLSPPPRLVVLYVLDALRADYVDLQGGPDSPTPNLARLAGEGVTFLQHLSVAPNTIPSTKSLFTGQTFFTQGNSKLSEDGPETLAEVFSKAGYRTAAFSGNEFVSDTYGTSRGFDHLAEEVVFRGYADVAGVYNDNAERVHASALNWLDGLVEDEAAFLYLHTIHPHNPYDPPDPLQERFVGNLDSRIAATSRNLLDIKHNRLEVTEEDQQRLAGLYTAALAYNDAKIGVLVEELTARFPAQEVLLILTSDHGEELFDHDGVLHGYTLYREQLQIPLVLWWPGRLTPQRIDHPTQNLDLHESLRALVGAPASAAGEGNSFWSVLGEERSQGDLRKLRFAAASSVQGGIFLAQSQRYKLIFAPRVGMNFGMGEGRGRGRDPEYLFDIRHDPEERLNLAGRATPQVEWMRSRLTAWIRQGLADEVEADEPTLDEETRARLRALGYLE